mmetsp:Transcript_43474/g.120302  ORF Transcript_43474/g.120302 Transcript_43474/m.120302 type:complete len:244 (+) Transcript_43474:289-1020(+)
MLRHHALTLKSLNSTPTGGVRFARTAFMPEMIGSNTRAAPSASVSGASSTAWLPPGFIQETQPGSTADVKMEPWRSSPAMVFANMFKPAFATFVCGCVLDLMPLGVEKEPSCEVTKTTKPNGALRKSGSHRAVNKYGTTRFTARTSTSSGISVSSSCCVQLVIVRKSNCSPCASVMPGGNHAAFIVSASSSLGNTGTPACASTGNNAKALLTKSTSQGGAGFSDSASRSNKRPNSSSRRTSVS